MYVKQYEHFYYKSVKSTNFLQLYFHKDVLLR